MKLQLGHFGDRRLEKGGLSSGAPGLGGRWGRLSARSGGAGRGGRRDTGAGGGMFSAAHVGAQGGTARASDRREGEISLAGGSRAGGVGVRRRATDHGQRIPRLRRMGLRPPRRMDRVLWKTRSRRHAQWVARNPSRQTRHPNPRLLTQCVNPVASGGERARRKFRLRRSRRGARRGRPRPASSIARATSRTRRRVGRHCP